MCEKAKKDTSEPLPSAGVEFSFPRISPLSTGQTEIWQPKPCFYQCQVLRKEISSQETDTSAPGDKESSSAASGGGGGGFGGSIAGSFRESRGHDSPLARPRMTSPPPDTRSARSDEKEDDDDDSNDDDDDGDDDDRSMSNSGYGGEEERYGVRWDEGGRMRSNGMDM